MATELIPTEWKTAVCGILTAGETSKIKVTLRAAQNWLDTFPDSWSFELYEELCRYLKMDDAVGQPVTTMRDPGTVYEFIFMCKGRSLYSKINLKPSGEVLIIYSAHPPLKGETL
jgi:hypothetical protein